MSDLSRLKSALRRAATDGPVLPRKLDVSGSDEALAQILRLIDTAVLARHLTVTLGDGVTLGMEAAGRRLFKLTGPVPPNATADQAALFELPVLKSEHAGAVAELLRALGGGQSVLEIVTARGNVIADGTTGGLSPEAIAPGLLSAPPRNANRPDPLDALVAAIESDLRGALFVHGDEAEVIQGDEAQVELLMAWAVPLLDRLLSPGFALADALDTNGIMVFGFGPDADRHGIILGHLGHFVLAAIDGADTTPTLAAWQDVSG